MDIYSMPYATGLIATMIDDFEMGQFGDGYFGRIARGRATLQLYFTGDFGCVGVQVHASSGLVLISSKTPMSAYLKSVASRHGVDEGDVHWEYHDLAWIMRERRRHPVDVSAVAQEMSWSLMTSKERGIMIACECDILTDDSIAQPEVSPPWEEPGVNTAYAFFRDLVPWNEA